MLAILKLQRLVFFYLEGLAPKRQHTFALILLIFAICLFMIILQISKNEKFQNESYFKLHVFLIHGIVKITTPSIVNLNNLTDR